MYVPKHFLEPTRAAARNLIRDYPFAQLVTTDDDGAPFATHLPFLFDGDRGDQGTLIGHMAKANPQWRHFANGKPALTIFAGPHGYISPSWYTAGPSVPTWNYIAVHTYGVPIVIDDTDAKRAVMERLVDTFESGFETPWRLGADGNEDFIAGMLKGIVLFDIPLDRVEAKAKLSQNRPAEDRAGVILGLRRAGNVDSLILADLMEERERDVP
jgi:transcriptional regulator